jgi:hypothetical protein
MSSPAVAGRRDHWIGSSERFFHRAPVETAFCELGEHKGEPRNPSRSPVACPLILTETPVQAARFPKAERK